MIFILALYLLSLRPNVFQTLTTASRYGNKSASGKKVFITFPIIGLRPKPPPIMTSKPIFPLRSKARNPISCARITALSFFEPVTATLNFLGKNWNSGWSVDH